jgi:hypothetical protein
MAPGSFNFELSDRWWRGCFNKHEIWLDERWGRLNPPHRPEHLDPWPREKRNRDEVLVPDSAWQRQDQRRKRRKTEVAGDFIVDKDMQDIISEPRPIISKANRMFTFSPGFQNLPKGDELITLLPLEIVDSNNQESGNASVISQVHRKRQPTPRALQPRRGRSDSEG